MTEAEWRACECPGRMLRFLRNNSGDRKLRLFAVSCCRRLLQLAADARHRNAVDVSERFADGRASLKELIAARGTMGASEISVVLVHAASMMAWHASEWAIKGAALTGDERAENAVQSQLLRDIFGNPFRPATFNPAWRTTTAVQLAQGLYDSRDFSTMPILADALQDAGCDNTDILDHCRGPGPHVLGC